MTGAVITGQTAGNIICAGRIRPRRQSAAYPFSAALIALTVLIVPALVVPEQFPVPIKYTLPAAVLAAAVFGGAAQLRSGWRFTDGRLSLHAGLLTRSDCGVCSGRKIYTELVRSPFLMLLGSCSLRVGSSGSGKTLLSLALCRSDARRASFRLLPAAGKKKAILSGSRRCGALSALVGRGNTVLLTLPLAWKLSRCIPEEPEWHTPAVILTLSLPFFLRAVMLLAAMSRTANIDVSLGGGLLTVRSGYATRRLLRVPLDAVSAADVSRPALLPVSSFSVTVSGGRYSPLPCSERQLRMFLSAVLPHSGGETVISAADNYSEKRAARRLLGGLFSAMLWLRTSDADLRLLTAPFIALLLCLAAAGAVREGIPKVSLCADSVEVSGVRGLSLRRQRIRRDAASMTVMTQSPLQRLNGTCTLRISPAEVRSGRFRPLSLRGLPVERAAALIERL